MLQGETGEIPGPDTLPKPKPRKSKSLNIDDRIPNKSTSRQNTKKKRIECTHCKRALTDSFIFNFCDCGNMYCMNCKEKDFHKCKETITKAIV